MKVILLQNVARIGQKFEVKEVPDGHALNFLIPKKLAEPATPHNLKRIQTMADTAAAQSATADAAFAAILEQLSGHTVEVAMEANDKGHLFKGVKADDIAAHLTAAGYAIEASTVVLDVPIKEIGTHEIVLKQGAQTGTCMLTVTKK